MPAIIKNINSCILIYAMVLTSVFFGALKTVAAGFLPVVTGYSISDYHGGMQNWQFSQDANGRMYVANNSGLLCFDGYEWTTTAIPNGNIVRSVLAIGNRIYIGSYADFGFFERDSCGTLKYTSIWPAGYKSHNDEIWRILTDDRGHIIFQSFCSWFDYDGHRVKVHYDGNIKPLWIFRVGSTMYMQAVGGGLYAKKNGNYRLVISRSAVGGHDVCAVMETERKGQVRIVTTEGCIYLYDGKNLTRWNTNIDNRLAKTIVNHAIATDNRCTLVIGTIKDGVFAVSTGTGKLLWHCNTHTLLRNNTVLDLFADSNGNVWAALDNGISIIHTSLPVALMPISDIGIAYGLTTRGNDTYIATNQQVWRHNAQSKEITGVENTEGQNWYAARFGEQLFVGNNMYTKIISENKASNINGISEGGATSIKPYTLYDNNALVESTYNGLRIYRKAGSLWQQAGNVTGFSAPVKRFEIDNDGSIWAELINGGFYHIQLSKNLLHATSVKHHITISGSNTAGRVYIMKIRGQVVFSQDGQLYVYDDTHKRFAKFKAEGLPDSPSFTSASHVDNASFWVSDTDGYTLYSYDGQRYHAKVFLPFSIFGFDYITSNQEVYTDGNYSYFMLSNGIGRYDLATNNKMPKIHKLGIDRVYYINSDNDKVALPVTTNKEVSVEVPRNITIKMLFPNFDHRKYMFHYTLKSGRKEIMSTSTEPEVAYSNIDYGEHTFTATVTDIKGTELSSTTYHFRCSTPWMSSPWAIALYALAVSVMVYTYMRWRQKKTTLRNQKEADEIIMRERMKNLEQERIINEQNRMLLEKELKSKGKEMSTIAFDMVAMKTNVENMRRLLMNNVNKGIINKKDVLKIIGQAGGTGNMDEMWKVFQSNFDLIHKSFFRSLRHKYPELTPNDLKLCAMLRLNLSTKDIAKYNNLTIRGIEGARYRLRKKLALPQDVSLVNFLIEFNEGEDG